MASSRPVVYVNIDRVCIFACVQVHLDSALDAAKLTGDEKFIFALHPHGVMSGYRIILDGVVRKFFPKVKSCRRHLRGDTVL